jgi:hypothetical protein
MKEIAENSRIQDGKKIAIIAALQLASSLCAKEHQLVQQIEQELVS